jgi:hypothetical protein
MGRHSTTDGVIGAPANPEIIMNAYDATQLFAKTLGNLEKWMDKAETHAKDRGFEVDVLAQSRLAPDQYSFVKQVQSACDQAKFAAAYLSGGKAPSHHDTEQTFPNFFFHATMAYAILRHNGVNLGKMDYIGGITTHEK